MSLECPIFCESEAFGDTRQTQRWITAFRHHFPHIQVTDWRDVRQPQEAKFAIVWQPNNEFFLRFPNLQAVFNLGAGVDGILANPYLPKDIDIYRIEDAGMAEQMNEYFAYHVMHFHRRMHLYQKQQKLGIWQAHPCKPAAQFHVGILGLGVLGASIGNCLKQLGYPVSGWSRCPKDIDGIHSYAGTAALHVFLNDLDALCCLLPLTAATQDILNYQTMKQLPQGAVIINAARGEHVLEKDLIRLLDEQHLAGAVLDTFRQEPLPADNPLWVHDKVILTPHCSAQSWIEPVVEHIGNNIDTLISGGKMHGRIDRAKGY